MIDLFRKPPSPPDARDLRKFGFALAGLSLAFGVGGPYLRRNELHLWPFGVALPLGLAAILAPRTLAKLHAFWGRLGRALGEINSRIVLGVIFFAVFSPIGIFLRMRNRDPLSRRWDPEAKSYRIPCAVNDDPRRLERIF